MSKEDEGPGQSPGKLVWGVVRVGLTPCVARPVLLRLGGAHELSRYHVEMQCLLQQVCVGPKSLISNKFPGDAIAAGPRTPYPLSSKDSWVLSSSVKENGEYHEEGWGPL